MRKVRTEGAQKRGELKSGYEYQRTPGAELKPI